MKIRKANKKDFKRISEIIKIEYGKKPYNEKWTSQTSLKSIIEYSRRAKIFVVLTDINIVGFIILEDYVSPSGREGMIDEVVIEKKYQGKGYGKSLIEFAENYFMKKKIKEVTLMSNTKSVAFNIYKKRNYKQDKHFVYMKKKLK